MNKKISPLLIKFIELLNDGDYHDGNTLGEALNITRSAVWKMVKKLQRYGIAIESHKSKGYKLLEPLILLQTDKIQQHLTQEKVNICIFESTTSTNDYFHGKPFTHDISICLAELQTAGRGRLHRTWYSPFAKNIYFSCLYHFQKDISELAGLSLVIGLAIIKTMKSFGINQQLFVKWPNDIIYVTEDERAKLSGCLVEIHAETHGMSHVIIGIGINVNRQETTEIDQPFTSMQKILGSLLDRNQVCAVLIKNLLEHLAKFNRLGFHAFIDEWMQADYLMNKTIELNTINEKIIGKMMGINAQGHILLELPDQTVRAFSSGDASLPITLHRR